jgi:hypothetical protein
VYDSCFQRLAFHDVGSSKCVVQVLCNCGVRELTDVLASRTWASVVNEEQDALSDIDIACEGHSV